MIMQKYTKEWLEELCASSYSYAEVLRKAGRKQGGGTQATLKKKIEEFEIDISHFTGQGWCGHSNNSIQREDKYKIEEIFVKNSPAGWSSIKRYIKKYNLIDYKCSKCGCDGHWQGGEIALQVDHIDGDHSNNELSNLRYLCPNCHALTETYCGRNIPLKSMRRDFTPAT